MELKRVEVISDYYGLTCMQVCVVHDASDKEILGVCNRENPSGTSAGWNKVVRKLEDVSWAVEGSLLGHCKDFPERIHFLIFC
jgi:hypothetical protein